MENVMNRTRDEMQYMQPSRTGKTFANIVIGTLVGAGAALLFAPKSGQQIRKDIAEQAHLISDQASKFSNEAAKMARQKAEKAQKQVERAQKQVARTQMPDLREINFRKKENNTGKWIAGIAIGSMIGAAIALLYAPKSGRQMREQLRREADELGSRATHMARETADQARSKAKEMAKEAEGEMKRQKEIMEDVNNRDYPL
jgi:gas vesicle protein